MASAGEKLRRERLRRHMELSQIAGELKISARLLEAIEDEKFERLPGAIFTKSFVRQYARFLGLDEEELVNEVQAVIESPFAIQTLLEAEPADIRAPLIHVPPVEAWESLREKRFSKLSWLSAAATVIGAMLLCSIIYSQWQPGPQQAVALPQTTEPPRPPATVVQSVPTPDPAAPPPAASPAPSDTPSASAAENGESINSPVVRLELTAREKVWISARADGKVLFSGMLTENETRTVEANDKLLLRVGNAGALDVTLNGKSLGALGAKGQPRTVQFTSGGFQTVAAFRPVLPL
jgi:cytoskeletal protein RodZ